MEISNYLKGKALKACPFCGTDPDLEMEYREDNHRYPREFWFAQISCSCGGTTGWFLASEQESLPKQEMINEAIKSWNNRVNN